MKKVLLLTLCLITLPVFAEYKNLNEYFEYLPNAVHKNWTPYKANKDYEVNVQFRLHKNGEISELQVVESTNADANTSALKAVKSGAPYEKLPASFTADSVKAQVQLKYIKHND